MGFRLVDGAMGTELIKRGLVLGTPSSLWNLQRPEDIQSVHRSYHEAGSQAITTNTFGANQMQLALHGMESQLDEINIAAIANVKSAALGATILGDIGPTGEMLEPYGDLEPDDLKKAVYRQGKVLAEGGVSAFLVETFSDPEELCITIDTLLAFGLPILATFAFEQAGSEVRTAWGTTPEDAALRAVGAGATATGANCGTELSLSAYASLARQMRSVIPDAPLVLQPNAGSPQLGPDGMSYSRDAEEFASWAREVLTLGEMILGGCCGTTPLHIRQMSQTLAQESNS
ncbi:MAG: homocysteine S-methyltransferase family protein [Fimbriimonadaceae bacterium]|nr:homocysteine S-methyltransferase family protein [Fimbriimonadaceae bacterium]